MLDKFHPEMKNLSRDEKLAKRTDPALSQEMTSQLRARKWPGSQSCRGGYHAIVALCRAPSRPPRRDQCLSGEPRRQRRQRIWYGGGQRQPIDHEEQHRRGRAELRRHQDGRCFRYGHTGCWHGYTGPGDWGRDDDTDTCTPLQSRRQRLRQCAGRHSERPEACRSRCRQSRKSGPRPPRLGWVFSAASGSNCNEVSMFSLRWPPARVHRSHVGIGRQSRRAEQRRQVSYVGTDGRRPDEGRCFGAERADADVVTGVTDADNGCDQPPRRRNPRPSRASTSIPAGGRRQSRNGIGHPRKYIG